tara:strand:+ start:337 stop:1005 length:669 start_codon:yes stop_codon:yes gene_type:complete
VNPASALKMLLRLLQKAGKKPGKPFKGSAEDIIQRVDHKSNPMGDFGLARNQRLSKAQFEKIDNIAVQKRKYLDTVMRDVEAGVPMSPGVAKAAQEAGEMLKRTVDMQKAAATGLGAVERGFMSAKHLAAKNTLDKWMAFGGGAGLGSGITAALSGRQDRHDAIYGKRDDADAVQSMLNKTKMGGAMGGSRFDQPDPEPGLEEGSIADLIAFNPLFKKMFGG